MNSGILKYHLHLFLNFSPLISGQIRMLGSSINQCTRRRFNQIQNTASYCEIFQILTPRSVPVFLLHALQKKWN